MALALLKLSAVSPASLSLVATLLAETFLAMVILASGTSPALGTADLLRLPAVSYAASSVVAEAAGRLLKARQHLSFRYLRLHLCCRDLEMQKAGTKEETGWMMD